MSFRLGLFALLCAARAAAAPEPSLEVTREGGVFRLQAVFDVHAPLSTAWDVLTDYDGMSRFLPSLRKSRVVERRPGFIVIEQEGVVRLLVFSRRVPITLKVIEQHPQRVEFSAVGESEFEEYEGAWTISTSSNPCRLSYQLFAEMKPSLVPRGLARRILEKSIMSQLRQIQSEIERRAVRLSGS